MIRSRITEANTSVLEARFREAKYAFITSPPVAPGTALLKKKPRKLKRNASANDSRILRTRQSHCHRAVVTT